MPYEELDPTTARLVSELSASMLPTLSKSLSAAVNMNDFLSAVDRTTTLSQDLRNQIEKVLRSSIDEGRANRSMIMQSMRSIADEITTLRKLIDRVPENLEKALEALNNNKSDDNSSNLILQELAGISELMSELIQGIRNLSEVYAKNSTNNNDNTQNFEAIDVSENNARLDKLLNNSLPGLEGLVKAHEKAQSHELEEFSKEIATLHEQNNLTMLHELQDSFTQALENFGEELEERKEHENNQANSLMLKILVGTSGACAVFSLVTLIMILLR